MTTACIFALTQPVLFYVQYLSFILRLFFVYIFVHFSYQQFSKMREFGLTMGGAMLNSLLHHVIQFDLYLIKFRLLDKNALILI